MTPKRDPVAANRQELPPDHLIRRRVEAGSAAAHAAMPSIRLRLPSYPQKEIRMSAATCSRCGHEKAEHGNDVLPFAPCQHLVEGRPATMRLLPYAYATESCWCPNYE